MLILINQRHWARVWTTPKWFSAIRIPIWGSSLCFDGYRIGYCGLDLQRRFLRLCRSFRGLISTEFLPHGSHFWGSRFGRSIVEWRVPWSWFWLGCLRRRVGPLRHKLLGSRDWLLWLLLGYSIIVLRLQLARGRIRCHVVVSGVCCCCWGTGRAIQLDLLKSVGLRQPYGVLIAGRRVIWLNAFDLGKRRTLGGLGFVQLRKLLRTRRRMCLRRGWRCKGFMDMLWGYPQDNGWILASLAGHRGQLCELAIGAAF